MSSLSESWISNSVIPSPGIRPIVYSEILSEALDKTLPLMSVLPAVEKSKKIKNK